MAAYLHSVGGGRSSANLFGFCFGYLLVLLTSVNSLYYQKKNSIEISTISNILAPLSFPFCIFLLFPSRQGW